jgi:hypothetical protein
LLTAALPVHLVGMLVLAFLTPYPELCRSPQSEDG